MKSIKGFLVMRCDTDGNNMEAQETVFPRRELAQGKADAANFESGKYWRFFVIEINVPGEAE